MIKTPMIDLMRTDSYPQIPKELVPNLSDDVLFAINDFLKVKVGVYRKQTLYLYLTFLPRAFSQIGIHTISDITKVNIRDWMNAYHINKSKHAQSQYICYLAEFLRYCQKRGLIAKFPITKRSRVQPSRSCVRNLDEQEYSKVKILSEILPLQQRVIVEFLDSTGARCGELLDIKVNDIDFINRKITVVGKGGKPRNVIFSNECSFLLKDLIAHRESTQDYVFISPTGKKMYSRYIYEIVSKLGKNAGVKGSLHPHKFRHSKATREIINGTALEDVKRMLGHRSIVTTMIYVHFISYDVKSDYERAMELNG